MRRSSGVPVTAAGAGPALLVRAPDTRRARRGVQDERSAELRGARSGDSEDERSFDSLLGIADPG